MARIAHLSDIHFGGENVAAVAGAASWIAANTPDVVVITGDITSFGRPAEFAGAAAWIGGLAPPVVITPGNHDTPYLGIVERLAAPFARFERLFGRADGVFWSAPGLAVSTLNTARGAQVRLNWSKGAVAHRQVVASLDRFGVAAGALRVVACHHPLVEMVGGPMTARVRGGERAARKLCEGGVDLILTGHIHAPFAMAFPYGDGRAYAVGASTLSVRERGVPAGFNLVDIDDAAIDVTALGWSGSGFETWRTWRLDRRGRAGTGAGMEPAALGG
ncbi:MAG: metallophosphoesterase [Caulobacteraceae bacterium]